MFPTFPFDLSLCSFLVPSLPAAVSGVMAPVSFNQIAPFESPSFTSESLSDVYSAIASATQRRMSAMQATPQLVAPAYATRPSSNGKFQLVADAWCISVAGNKLAELRFVKIDGAKSNIINAWIFPSQPNQHPVFAAELIGVNDVTRVAFIDIQTPALNSKTTATVESLTRPIAQRYASLPCDEPAPDWAICESTGNYTYSRGASGSNLKRVSDCYFNYLDCYLNECLKPAAVNSLVSKTSAQQLHDYQMHHMEHSPGKKFLGNLFGHDWTHQFMTEFLFAKAKD